MADEPNDSGRLRRWASAFDRSVGRGPTALIFGLVALAIACVYVTPARECVNYGHDYEVLSKDPYHPPPNTLLRLRILTPFLAHTLHFRGETFIFFPLLIAALLLAAVYLHHRRQDFSPLASLSMIGVISFSTPILFLIHFQCYTDVTSYVLVVAAMACIAWPEAAAVLFALGCLNHESTLFALPAVLGAAWLRRGGIVYTARFVGAIAASVCAVFLIRARMAAGAGQIYTSAFYLDYAHIRANVLSITKMLPLGIFMSFRALWALPVAAVVVLARKGEWRTVVVIVAIVAGAAGQLLLASDTSRLLGMAFPAFFIAATALRSAWGDVVFTRRLGWCLAVNAVLPIYYVGQEGTSPLFSLPTALAVKYLFGVDLFQQWWTP